MTEVKDIDREAAYAALELAWDCASQLGRDLNSETAMLFAAHREAAAKAERDRIVAWLRCDNSLCDCFAHGEGECACGGWSDYKTRPLLDIANDIESGEHL